MREALKSAQLAQELGEVPIGAVLVHDGQIIGRGYNLRETSQDPTTHAEMLAIRQAATQLYRSIEADAAAPATEEERRRWLTMILAAFLFTLWGIQMFAYLTWLPDYLVNIHGHSPRAAALLFVIPVAVLTAFNLIAAPILRAGVPVALLFVCAVGIQTGFWLLMPYLDVVSAAIGAFFIYAAAAGVAPTCLFAMPGTIFGIDRAGSKAFGVLMTGRNLGVLCGPLLTGAIVEFTGGWQLVPDTLGVVGLCAIAGALLLHSRLRRVAQR
jgi:MFS family permease